MKLSRSIVLSLVALTLNTFGCSDAEETPSSTDMSTIPDVASDMGTDTEYIDPTLDTDEDGITDVDEIRKWGTNPIVADTDGDGFTDYDEIVTKAFDPNVNIRQFNPRVADVPRLNIQLLNAPAVGMNYTENMSNTLSVGTERTSERSSAVSRAWGGSQSHAVESSHTKGITVGVETGFGVTGADTSVSVSLSYEETHSTNNETTNEWSDEQSFQNSQALAQLNSTEAQTGVEVLGGWLEVVVQITNPSDIAYVLDGMTLTAYRPSAADPLAIDSIGTLQLLDNLGTFEPTVLSPGDTFGPAEFAINDLDLDTTKDLLGGSENLVIAPLTYAMRGADNVDFELASTNINARTARVIIDYGLDQEPEEYRVATVLDQDAPGITVDTLFTDILRIPHELGTSDWRFGAEETPRDSFTGLTSIRDRAMSADQTSYWVVTHTHTVENGARVETDLFNLIVEDYDLANLTLQKGDTLHFVYIQDVDRDGLGLRTELIHGTDPDDADTDDDGLNDAFELAGWQVNVMGAEVTYTSDPTVDDTDHDGVNDGAEFADGTNPRDPLPEGIPVVAPFAPVNDGFNGTLDLVLSSPETQVVRVDIDWGDGTAVETITGMDLTTVQATHRYATLGTFMVTVLAYDRFDTPSNPESAPAYISLPGNPSFFMNFDQNVDNQAGQNPDVSLNPVLYGADKNGLAFRSLDMNSNGDAGSYQLVSLNDSNLLTGSFTLSAWVYATGWGSNGSSSRLVGQDDWFNLYSDGDGISFGRTFGTNSANGNVAEDTGSVGFGQWVFVAGVVEDLGNGTSSVRLYVNGTLEDSYTENTVFTTPSNCRFFIGRRAEQGCLDSRADEFGRFHGNIDDVRVYPRALSDAEIEMLGLATPE